MYGRTKKSKLIILRKSSSKAAHCPVNFLLGSPGARSVIGLLKSDLFLPLAGRHSQFVDFFFFFFGRGMEFTFTDSTCHHPI